MRGVDDKRYIKKTYETENNPTESHSTKSDYYGLNIATFTFGGKQPHLINNQLNLMKGQYEDELANRKNFRKTNSSKRIEIDREKDKEKDFVGSNIAADKKFLKREKEKENFKENNRGNYALAQSPSNNINYQVPNNVVFLNKIGSHNSFLSVVIHFLSNIAGFRNFILNELNTNNEKDMKYKLLYELKNLMMKYLQPPSNNNSNTMKNTYVNKLDITKLRITLAELFQNRRKFLIDQPDDPIDCFFAFINAAHSYAMV
jgi:hypothetical protein